MTEDEMVALATYLRRCCEQSRTRSAMTPVPAGSLLEAADALTALSSERELLRELLRQSCGALQGMMDAWFDYHDSHSLTQPATGAAGNAFDKALEARDAIDAALTGVTGG